MLRRCVRHRIEIDSVCNAGKTRKQKSERWAMRGGRRIVDGNGWVGAGEESARVGEDRRGEVVGGEGGSGRRREVVAEGCGK